MSGKSVILAYHSLSSSNTNRRVGSGYVSPRQRIPVSLFERQIRWLSQFVDFVSLNDIVENTTSNQWRVAVTFDDGYRDNIELGIPIFRKYELPVTWFVCNRFVRNNDYLPWWDLVDYMASQVRKEVKLEISNNRYKLDKPKEKGQFIDDLRKAFLSADLSSREVLYENLRKKCSRFVSLPPNAFADQALVRQAASSPWISIGGHTMTHPNLASISFEQLEHEVRRGREQLQKWTGDSVDWFAYPYGGKSTYNTKVKRAVNEAGFGGAVTTTRGYVTDDSDFLELPRFMVPSWAGMAGFKAGILALNEVDWLSRKADWLIRWSRKFLRSI